MLPLEIVPNKLSLEDKKERAKQLLSLVGLEGFEEKRPSELSTFINISSKLSNLLLHAITRSQFLF